MNLRIDDFDLRLLSALQHDGRLTNHELAQEVGLSASQCSRRRMALEESGIIERYQACLSSEALGFELIVFVEVSLSTHSPDNAKAFTRLLDDTDEVQEAYSLTGDSDYLIKLIVTDFKRLSDILNNVFLHHKSVAKLRSSVVLDRLKQTSNLPLRTLRI
ncbi:MAG: Lrp/AsnC family transcriptional regulator [Pseudomonadota bacterium]